MCRRSFCQFFLFLYILTLVCASGCVSNGNSRGKGLDDSSLQKYGWWVGARGKSVGVDIETKGSGLQITIVRSYLSHSKINSPIGMRWTHNYLMHIGNAPNKRIKLWRADGTTLMFTPTTPGTLTTDDDDALVLTQKWDGTHSLQDGEGTEFGFNRKGRLIHIHGHEYGNIISLAYGADGYLESISDSKGQVITFYYDSETHRLRSIRDGRGRVSSYKHDPLGNLIAVTNADGITSDYSYDLHSRLVGVTFP